jgi:CrcB protein
MVARLTLLALGGALGTLGRYGVQVGLVQRSAHPALGTAAVNLLGCLLLGLAWGALDRRELLGGDLKLIVVTGMLGAFTTFSALMFDTARLARDDSLAIAIANVGGQVVLGGALLVVGVLATRLG